MGRFWSLVFLLVPVLGTAAFACAAMGCWPLAGAWLPENLSESGNAVDSLWSIAHGVTAFFFVGFGLVIAWLLWRFADHQSAQASYFKGNLKVESIWILVPAALLVFLAFYQFNVWNRMRVDRPMMTENGERVLQSPLVHVMGRQYGWEFHYAGRDRQHGTPDDYKTENMLVVPDDQIIVLQLESRDVIHSFYVPKLRLKNDVVPGMTSYTWFKPLTQTEVNVLCAELCGWGHYKMNARLKIVSRGEFDRWDQQQQNRIAPPTLDPIAERRPLP